MDTAKILDELQTSVVKLSFDKGYIKGTLDPEVTPKGWKIKQNQQFHRAGKETVQCRPDRAGNGPT